MGKRSSGKRGNRNPGVKNAAVRDSRPKVRHQRHKSAGVIVYRRAGDQCFFLLVLSKLTKRALWEFPKGGVEKGETLVQAALRELSEETGILENEVVLVPDFQRTEDYRFTAGDDGERTLIHKQVTYFLGETNKSAVTLSAKESSEFAWLSLEDALKRVRYTKRKKLLMDVAETLGVSPISDPDIPVMPIPKREIRG
jgi:bis(5'-nucleosidyl)-tetraphosphatase